MKIPCRGQTRGTRARYTRKLYSSEDTPASLPGSHQRGALQEDIGRHSGVLRRRCRGAGLGYRESLVAEALREGDDSTESRWRSLAEARPETREAGCLDYMYERDQAGSECTEITSAHRLLVRVQEVAAERRNANILRARRKRRLGSRAGLHRWFTRAL